VSMLRPQRIIQVGPGLKVRGGVSSVERLILEAVGQRAPIEHVATMEDGTRLRKAWVFACAIWRIRRILRETRPLAFHVHFGSHGSAFRKYVVSRMVLRTPNRLILHAHGAQFDSFFLGLPGIFQKRLSKVVQEADELIVLSSQWQEFYSRNLGRSREKISVLINPTQPPDALPDRGHHERVQFLFMGRMGTRKGTFELLEAFAALPTEARQRARLVFAGDGMVEELRTAARAVGSDVAVHSWLSAEDRDKLLGASDVLVLPSRAEGVPMAILEAMSHGIPVITTPVGGIPDVVTDMKEGLFIGVGDQTALTAAMTRLIDDPELRCMLGSGARARAESLSITHYAERLMKLYQ
jgi:glycosyltransferase involved in cell wall biosynthesis